MPATANTAQPYIVKRTLTLADLSSGQPMSDLIAVLSECQGNIDFRVDPRHKRLRISYDVRQILFDDIVQLLSPFGLTMSTSGWMRFKANWYRLLDDNARANVNSKGGACCSNPTEIYARRNRRG